MNVKMKKYTVYEMVVSKIKQTVYALTDNYEFHGLKMVATFDTRKEAEMFCNYHMITFTDNPAWELPEIFRDIKERPTVLGDLATAGCGL
jgi:hypothetical protein